MKPCECRKIELACASWLGARMRVAGCAVPVVAGEHPRRMRSQERSPRRLRSLWRRLETCLEQHLAHGGRRHGNAETFELADDPFVSPLLVLHSETHDQLA